MKRLDFNNNWTVKSEDGRVRQVNLPDDAMLFEERSAESKASGACGYFIGGKYTYTKNWIVPAEYTGKKMILECEGVYQNSHVLVNGEELYFRPYGYTNYFVDLTEKLIPGQSNEITIIADNANTPNSRWYSGSGIYREVALYVGNPGSIAPEGIKIHTLNKNSISVQVELEDSTLLNSSDIEIEVNILDDDRIVASTTGATCEIGIPDAICWSETNPKLYTCMVTVKKNGELLDAACEKFGIRTVTWNAKGLQVNGEEVLLRGACIHHDNGILGACNFADAEYRRVKILKEAGFNAIRSAHNPMSKAMLRACDELGVYVMDENFDMWFIHKNAHDYGGDAFRKWWMTDVKQMIDKDYNHPSVIMYSIGNEISDLGAEEGQQMCKDMSDFVRSLDSSRAITMGCNLILASMVAKGKGMYGEGKEAGTQTMDAAPTSEFFNVLMNKAGALMELGAKGKGPDAIVEKTSCYMDIPGYNYAGARYKDEVKQYPNRPFVGSETLPKRLAFNWKLVKSIPQLVGDFMWTGWDYLGEAGIGLVKYSDKKTKKPVEPGLIILGGCGVIDITGKILPEVQWNKLIWGLSTSPEIAVEPMNRANCMKGTSIWREIDGVASWSWDGCEGCANNVTVYADGAKVKLIVNGKTIGTKKVKEYKATFKKVPYIPGTIEAKVYDTKGNEIGSKKLTSATGETQITVTADKQVLRPNGQDLCFIDLDLTGTDGVLKANDDRKLTIHVEGPGVLQAFGSARPNMTENYYSTSHTTYRGHALAVIRAGYEAGDIKVTVSGEGMATKTVVLSVV